MRVLSLFDGMSCGRIAIDRSGLSVTSYHASEIDQYAQIISKKNYPEIVHVGDINHWKKWKLPAIDLIMGGSPCQGFSNAGIGRNFDDPRSKLFYTFVDIVRKLKPKYFLLENVKMKKEWADIISAEMGVEPIEINSALLSAQNRKRFYWTNIPNVKQPEDKGIVLADIIEEGYADREKAYAIDANYHKGGNLTQYFDKSRRQLVFRVKEATKKGYVDIYPNEGLDLRFINSKTRRGRSMKTKCNALASSRDNNVGWYNGNSYRQLTPLECERLQTLPDNYTEGVSNTQRYKMIGNGWTVDVIAHILRNIQNRPQAAV